MKVKNRLKNRKKRKSFPRFKQTLVFNQGEICPLIFNHEAVNKRRLDFWIQFVKAFKEEQKNERPND